MAIPAKPVVSSFPPPPLRGENRDIFKTKANNLVAHYPTFVTDMNDAIDWQNTVYTATETEATNAASSATLSEDWATSTVEVSGGLKGARGYAIDAAQSAEDAATAAEVVNFQGLYSAGTTYSTGQAVAYNNLYYVSLVDSNTGNQPDVSPSQWCKIGYTPVTYYQEFTASGTWTKPEWANFVYVEAVGGGGGGGAYDRQDEVGGGGGGQGVAKIFLASGLDSTVVITIGSGGLGGASGGQNTGNKGGSSSFGSYVISEGGYGGGSRIINTVAMDCAGGGGTQAQYSGNSSRSPALGSYQSGSGSFGGLENPAIMNNGGNSVIGGAGGGGADISLGYYGGVSQFGGHGGDGSAQNNVSASNGGFPGGGGGGSSNGGAGGDGADGRVRIWAW